MRQGELLGLRWCDVDLQAGIVRVTGTLQRGKGGTVAEPKTAHSRRAIWLADPARQVLLAHRDNVPRECEWVYPNHAGRPWDARNLVRRMFEPLLARAELHRIRFHDLRHTFCTLMLELGINPKIVSEMAGHASVAITLDLYSHALPGMHRQAANMLGQVLTSGEPFDLAPGSLRRCSFTTSEDLSNMTCGVRSAYLLTARLRSVCLSLQRYLPDSEIGLSRPRTSGGWLSIRLGGCQRGCQTPYRSRFNQPKSAGSSSGICKRSPDRDT